MNPMADIPTDLEFACTDTDTLNAYQKVQNYLGFNDEKLTIIAIRVGLGFLGHMVDQIQSPADALQRYVKSMSAGLLDEYDPREDAETDGYDPDGEDADRHD